MYNRLLAGTCAVVLSLVLVAGDGAPLYAASDAEAATHDTSAAFVSPVDTYEFPGFSVIQFDLGVLSHYSYLLVSEGKALLVDPLRDVVGYQKAAREGGFEIIGTFLTHNHADFVAGHLEAAKAFGAPIYVSADAGVGFSHTPLTEDSTLQIGAATVKFLATPGHTPESMCGLVYGTASSTKPEMLFTGDTLFIGSIGRPDLMGGTVSAAWLASKMYDSWHDKLKKLDDAVKILPAHGAGSLCGAHLSEDPISTIGEQRVANPYFKFTARNEFIAAVLDGLPQAPQYFGYNAAMNKKGPALVDWDAVPPTVAPTKELMDAETYYVVDIRAAEAFAAGHVPNSVNIALRGRLETWTGIMVPWGSRLVLVGEPDELKEAARRYPRIGYRPEGMLTFDSWKAAGLPVLTNARRAPADLYAAMKAGTAPVIVDVRLPKEWMAAKIGNVVNMPLNELAKLSHKLQRDEPVVAVCNSAFRSSLALGILEREGFTKVTSLEGGGEAWKEAGYPMIQATTSEGTTPASLRSIALPERVSADALSRTLQDLPSSVDVVDLRPAEHFADYAIPGSRNADVVDVLTNASYLAGSVPLVLVCRDGSISMAVGGALAQKTKRPIRVLYGGVAAYWNAAGLGGNAVMPTTPARPAGAPTVAPRPAPRAAPVAPAPAPTPAKRRRSAGC